MTNQIEELYTAEEIYPKFKVKNVRSLNYQLNKLRLKHPDAKCLNRKLGTKWVFNAQDVKEIQTLCLNL
jgi:hypothetical protein|tara:strand:+ start:618 stop:824 length:207 start_codon:yes stop_codon:yes gene_type:complete